MSVNIQFPSNPENGMIFEVVPGVFYKYNAGSNCWARLKGVESLGLATPLVDGLMSKEDYTKLQNLVVPPPQATLKGEECDTTFKSGTVALYSFDDSLEISKNLRLKNQTPKGSVEASQPWQLHQNTAGFDFRVPIERLIQEIEERNQFKKVQLQGDKGPKGLRGEPGRDRLDTGPEGPPGEVGANAPFTGSLTLENIPFELAPGNSNRAIVDVTTEEISKDENYLVMTRANIGNPDACPAQIIPKRFNSPLVVALQTIEGGKLVKTQTVNTGDCALICRICASSLHHLNLDDIVCAIHDHFLIRVEQLKLEKEALVRAWLDTMISLFSEQKAALCCALENCRSRYRNERTRQYLETQRIQAALGDFGLVLGGSTPRCEFDEAVTLNMDQGKDCPIKEPEFVPATLEDGCLVINLDPKIHIGDPRAIPKQSITAYLEPGDYIAEITECCANFNDSINSPAYSGRAAILYQALTSIDSGGQQENAAEPTALLFPNFGTFQTNLAARNAYQGLTMTFSHAGGEISFWLLDPDGFTANNSGKVTIKVIPVPEEEPTTPEAVGFLYVYRDEISFDSLLGRITTYVGNINSIENFGTLPNDVNLTVGPALVEDKAQIFFFDGTDGLSMYFVAGEQPSSSNDQIANILADVSIQNNTFMTTVRANDSDADVKQISSSEYQAALNINSNSSGFVIGEFDPMADFSIRVDPRDLSTMRTFVAASADGNDIIIAQGGSEGIGGNISASKINTAPLYEVGDVPPAFGGGNRVGLRVNNENSGQNVYFTRPINIDLSATFTNNSGVLPSSISTSTPGVPGTTITGTPTKEIKVTDGDFPETRKSLSDDPIGPWSEFVRMSGRSGSSAFTIRQNRDGNPGAYRETSHRSSFEERRIVSTSRPSKSYFGPGSLPAIPWNLSYATDQFGNTWLFVRETSGASANGENDIFIRDATTADFQFFQDKMAENVFPNGSSGVATGTVASGNIPAVPAIISTFHITSNNSYTPAEQTTIVNFSLQYHARIFDRGSTPGFEVGMALMQDGVLYASTRTTPITVPSSGLTTTPQGPASVWLTGLSVPASVVSEFGAVGNDGTIDPNNNPNFGVTGKTIRFGYFLRSTHSESGIEERLIGIDNVTFCLNVEDLPVEETVKILPTVDNVPQRVIDEKGDFVDEDGSRLPRGATGSPQDPCVVDICTSVRSPTPQSMRYILTDKNGVKFYSATSSIDVKFLNQFQAFSFGAPITALAPPPEFTTNIISSKKLDLTLVQDQLSATQLRTAESLNGISRLTYIQSIIGIASDAIPNARSITDIEIELINTPFSSTDFGFISAKVGLPGALTEILIDDFHADEIIVGQTPAEPIRIQGTIKRTVATLDFQSELQTAYNGNVPSQASVSGLEHRFAGIHSYFGDYTGFDTASPGSQIRSRRQARDGRGTLSGNEVDFHGNNFFAFNRVGTITQITGARGFNNVPERSGETVGLAIPGNPDTHGNMAVSDTGVIYIAYPQGGLIYAIISANAGIPNTTHGDVHDQGSNFIVTIAEGLPSAQHAVITLGKKNIKGAGPNPVPPGDAGVNFYDEILANFGGQWYRIDGLPATLWRRGPASRDTSIPRCCFDGNKPGERRNIATLNGSEYVAPNINGRGVSTRTVENGGITFIGTGIAPNGTTSITTDKNANQQPALPVPSNPSSRLAKSFPYDDIAIAVQAELDRDFNQFNLYQLTDGIIYKVDQNTGSSTIYRELGENAFDLKANPRTKDLYYVVNNGPAVGDSTNIPTGDSIRYVDIDDLDKKNNNLPRIKSIITIDTNNSDELFQGITFGQSVPPNVGSVGDSGTTLANKSATLYALLSTAANVGDGTSTNDSPVTRLVEIAERVVPFNPGIPISAELPSNSRWTSYVTGGALEGNPSRVIFSRLTPGGGCQMHYKQVQWYERGWRTGACCGALVEVNGIHYIIVKRSIGVDTTCGGGESLSTPCIAQFIEIDEGHPAIAWPTSDPDGDPFEGLPGGGGDEFLGLPTSGFVNFVKDEALSNQILSVIRSGGAIRTVGKPASNIPFILFPAA